MTEWRSSRREALGRIGTLATSILGVSQASAQDNTEVTITVEPNEATVTPGETTTVDVVILGPTDGIGGYEITLDISESTIATFDEFEEHRQMFSDSEIRNGGQEMRFITALGSIAYDGATEIVIGNVTLEGGEAGESPIMITDVSVGDKDNNGYETATQQGTVTVQSGEFLVGIVDTNSPVTAGEVLSVTVNILNTGGTERTQTVTLDVPGLGADEKTTTLAGDESTTETLSVATESGDAGAYTATVASEDDEKNTSVAVEQQDTGTATFEVELTGTNSPSIEGDILEVTAAVTNTGDASGTDIMTLDVGSLGSDATPIPLDSGESTDVTFSIQTGDGDAGEYTATVSTDDSSAQQTVAVLEPAAFTITITDMSDPVAGEPLNAIVSIENTGDTSDTQEVELGTPGLGSDSATVSLDGGGSAARTLSVSTEEGDAGEYTVTVSTDDDSSEQTVTVLASSTFTVNITDVSAPVAGEPLEATVSIENTGDDSGSQTIELSATDLGSTSTTVSLDGGEATTETLSLSTDEDDDGEYTVTVDAGDDSTQQTVTVLAPAAFTVAITDVTAPVAGDSLAATVSIENTGDTPGEQTIELSASGLGSDSTTVSLDGGESTTETLSLQTTEGDAGEYSVTVDAGDDDATETETVTVAEPDPGDASGDDGGASGDDSESSDDGGPSDGSDTSDDSIDGDSSGGGGLGTTEMAAIGGGGTLALLFGAYALMRRADDDGDDSTPERPSEPDTPGGGATASTGSQSPDSGEQESIDDLLDDVTGILDSARQSADAGEYDRALARCEQAIGTAKEARATARADAPDRVPDAEGALDEATALRETIRAERDAREGAIEDLDTAEGALTDADAALDDGSLDSAFESLDDALAALTDAGDAIEDQDLPDLAERTDRLDSRHDDLRERAETLREAHRRVTDELDTVEDALDDAAAALESDTPGAALDHLDGLAGRFDTASGPVEEHDLPALADRLATLEQRHERLRREVREARTGIPATVPDTPRLSLSYDDIERGRRLGRGGNADVFRATTATDGGVDLALKKPRMNDIVHAETVERMLEEVRTRAQGDTDYVVSVMDTRHASDVEAVVAEAETHRRIEEHDTVVAVVEETSDAADRAIDTADTWVRQSDEDTVETVTETLHSRAVTPMMREAETWQKLDDHDNIVTVVDYDEEPVPWIAMEYMDGGHLGRYAGAMEIDRALWTAIATAEGVIYAHDHGVAHFDLKPQNVLLRQVEGGWDVPKVADWGLSKQLLEHSNSVEGMSPGYAAPEQFDTDGFGRTDRVTDVYQLGAVFYALFTGRPPFEGPVFQVVDKIKTEMPAPPSEVADLPPELDDILLTALATEKTDRYERVPYMRDDLQELFDSYR